MLPLSNNYHHTIMGRNRKSIMDNTTSQYAIYAMRYTVLLFKTSRMFRHFLNKPEKQSIITISDDICLVYFNIRRETARK